MRPLLVSLFVALGVSAASAQTVIVTNATPGSTVEFVLNGTVVASGTAPADGIVRLPSKTSIAATSVDALVWVDVCDNVARIHVVARLQPTPAITEGCTRTQIPGTFVVQRVTNFVVNVSGSRPSLLLRQGEAPEEWLLPPKPEDTGPRISIAPVGLVLSGGMARGSVEGFAEQFCGDVTSCTADTNPIEWVGGASLWLTKYLGVEATLVKPQRMTVEGSGTNFRFDSEMDGAMPTFAGIVGVPVGRVRLYGTAGAHYFKTTFTTNQTLDQRTVTVDGVDQTIPGGTQSYGWRSTGWGLLLGGGGEVWFNPRVGMFGELKRFDINAEDESGSEAETAYTNTSIFFGVRVKIIGG